MLHEKDIIAFAAGVPILADRDPAAFRRGDPKEGPGVRKRDDVRIGRRRDGLFVDHLDVVSADPKDPSMRHHVHEADQQYLYNCVTAMHDQLEALPPEDHHEYRTVLHYRFKKANGQYIYLHDEKAILNLRGGNLYYSLFRDITNEKVFAGVKAELFRQQQTLVKISEFKPGAERNQLSKRETELLNFIKQGLSTKEIAWYLDISPNTVRNIKSKLFEKYNVGNSIELLNMAG